MEPQGQQQRVERWLSAISEASPAGENARNDSAHEILRNAVANLESVQAAPVDWTDFSSTAELLLTTRSKDLLIAGYLAYGLFQTEGLEGLANGLALISGILERYWDDCFPEVARMRGRVNAVSWFIERASNRLRGIVLNDADRAALASLAVEAERFLRVIASRFDPGAIELAPFQQTLEQIGSGVAIDRGANGVASSLEAISVPSEPTAGQAPSQDPAASPEAAGEVTKSPKLVDPVGARLSEIAKPFVDAISGEAPAGENARYDQRHEAIRKEIEKLGKPSAGEADWQLVRDQGRSLLVETSKDYLIASYFAVASYAVGGLPGLVEGILALSSLLEHYWDTGFPPSKRLRARINAIDWFIDRLEFVEEVALDAVEVGDLALLSQAGKGLETLVLARFEDEAPNVYRLRDTLERIKLRMAKHAGQESAPQPDSEFDPAPTPVEQASTKASTGSGSGAATTHDAQPSASDTVLAAPSLAKFDPDNIDKFLQGIGDAMLEGSGQLFGAAPASPLSYRLTRLGLYLHITEPPLTKSGNQTYVPAPRWERNENLSTLVASQNWVELLRETEPALPKERFWLDLHRYVALALAGLGHEAARETVLVETAAFVRRLPGILDLEFSDGRPFASPETREWLAGATRAGPGDASPTTSSGEENDDGFAQKLREAHQTARGGNLQEAIDMLNAAIALDPNGGRDRFRAKLAMAGACAAARAHALAEGILAGLAEEIQRFQLEIWEPKLAEACYRARYEALMAVGTDGTRSNEELVNVYRQLCKVSPSLALSLRNPGTNG